jgi:drug/metabolite transporter (DMT)-like permease
MEGRPPRSRVLLALAAVYVVWGSTYLGIRFAIESIPPLLMAGGRFVLAGLVLLAWARRRGEPWPTAPQWVSAAVAGALFFLGGNGGLTWAETRVPSGIAALIVAAVPLWTALFDWWRPRGRRPAAVTAAGLLLGFLGVGVLVDPRAGDAARVDPLGAAVLMAATVSWAVGSIWTRETRHRLPPAIGAGSNMLAGGIGLVLAALPAGEFARIAPGAVTAKSWAAFLYLVTAGSLIGFTAYAWLLRHVSAPLATSYAYVNPIVAMVFGWALAGEPLTPRVGLATVVTVAGLVLITAGPFLVSRLRVGSRAAPVADG